MSGDHDWTEALRVVQTAAPDAVLEPVSFDTQAPRIRRAGVSIVWRSFNDGAFYAADAGIYDRAAATATEAAGRWVRARAEADRRAAAVAALREPVGPTSPPETIARLTAERDDAARILAALRALPPETVADVRGCAGLERAASHFASIDGGRAEHTERARRLDALADLLDAVREVPRG